MLRFQRHAVQAVRGGRDAIVVAPTGGGKSLCYQLPALMLDGTKGRFAIVVSPLQALMREQVEELNDGARRRGRTADVACLLGEHADVAEEVALSGASRTGRRIHTRSPTAHPAPPSTGGAERRVSDRVLHA